jgi:hypothetical protein
MAATASVASAPVQAHVHITESRFEEAYDTRRPPQVQRPLLPHEYATIAACPDGTCSTRQEDVSNRFDF